MTRIRKAMEIRVKRIDPSQLLEVYFIREKVFVEEQKVPKEDEIDGFERVCHHYLATNENGTALGTARWRRTESGIKLERFAVLKDFRKMGVGSQLMTAVLKDVMAERNSNEELIYLHSQMDAMPLYEKFNFKKEGAKFDECGIQHYKMVLAG